MVRLTKEEVEHNYCITEECATGGCELCKKTLKKYQDYLKKNRR